MDHRTRRVIEAVIQNPACARTVVEMARIAGTSQSGLRLMLRDTLGLGPKRFLKKVRLERARVLLLSDTHRVKEIMGLVGYSDFSHFARDFERAYGLPPRQYRRELLKSPPRNGQ
jgi:AraC-like DNA-binding protein